MGAGEGGGEGRGAVSDENVIIGSAVAIGLTIFMCVCGVPMIFAGIVLVVLFDSGGLFQAGVALLVISCVLLVIGLVFIVLLCTGVIGRKNTTHPGAVVTTTTMYNGQQGAVTTVQQHQQGMVLQPGYPAVVAQPGYPAPVPQAGYPFPQAGYYPSQPVYGLPPGQQPPGQQPPTAPGAGPSEPAAVNPSGDGGPAGAGAGDKQPPPPPYGY